MARDNEPNISRPRSVIFSRNSDRIYVLGTQKPNISEVDARPPRVSNIYFMSVYYGSGDIIRRVLRRVIDKASGRTPPADRKSAPIEGTPVVLGSFGEWNRLVAAELAKAN